MRKTKVFAVAGAALILAFIVLAGLLFFPGPQPADEAGSIAALCARRDLQAVREARQEMTVRDTAAATGIKELKGQHAQLRRLLAQRMWIKEASEATLAELENQIAQIKTVLLELEKEIQARIPRMTL
jgi:hypothetical protein